MGVDRFLIERPVRPKAAVAEYLEGKGIAVPRRFATQEEALDFVAQGGQVIVRSEHPQDYDGA